MQMTLSELCLDMAQRARAASGILATTGSAAKDAWLRRAAAALTQNTQALLDANARDLGEAERAHLPAAMLDRLRLTPARIDAMAEGLRQVAGLPDPIGRVRDGHRIRHLPRLAAGPTRRSTPG